MQILRPAIIGLVGACLSSTAGAQLTQRVNLGSLGEQANSISSHPVVSPDGRFVLFDSSANNLVAGDTNGWQDVFLRDRVSGVTTLVSVGTGGVQANGPSVDYALSADGRFVAFQSYGSNLASGDTNGTYDIFVHDCQTGQTTWASVSSLGVGADSNCFGLALSLDGRCVSFCSAADNLVPGDTNGSADVFVRDLQTGQTSRVSVDSGGAQADGQSLASALSADGRFVAFSSYASNLVPGDTNALPDIFVHDRQTGQTTRVSLDSGGTQSNGASGGGCSISSDGRWVAFSSQATNLVAGDTNNASDVFLHDVLTGETTLVSLSSSGAQGSFHSGQPSVSDAGRYIVFESIATNLVAGDTNQQEDIFLRDQFPAGFSSLCDPGFGGVMTCPCANPATQIGSGCNNSAATGGARLTAAGAAYLSIDGLVLTSSDEPPSATSILLQGDAEIQGGAIFGQGVRCVGGVLKRLYVKAAVAGSVSAPDFAAGDPSLSTRSAALGDLILAGTSRYYLVYYRDPFVLGGCPASSTFNSTTTGRVDWSL